MDLVGYSFGTLEDLRRSGGKVDREFGVAWSKLEKQSWIDHALEHYGYDRLPREDKGVIRVYLQGITGYSRAQIARNISRHQRDVVIVADVTQEQRGLFRPMLVVSAVALLLLITGSQRGPDDGLKFLNGEVTAMLPADKVSTSDQQTYTTSTITAQRDGSLDKRPLFVVSNAATVMTKKTAVQETILATTTDQLRSKVDARRQARLASMGITRPDVSIDKEVFPYYPSSDSTHASAPVAEARFIWDALQIGKEGQILMVRNGKPFWRDFPYVEQIREQAPHGDEPTRRAGGSRSGGGGNGGGESTSTTTTTTIIQQGGGGAASGWTDGTGVVYLTDANDSVGIGTDTPSTKLEVIGSISGASLYITGSMSGAGLTDCDAANQTLQWDETTGRFSCGADDGGAGSTYTAGRGLALSAQNSFSLNAIITGSLVRFTTLSGSIVTAKTSLASSGSLVWEGSASGASLWVSTFEGAGLSDCDLSTQTLGWDDTLNRFTCGSDADTTYTAGRGLGLTGTSFSLNDTITGSLLEFTTVSGSTVYASAALRSSGSLVWEGSASGASLWISTFEGAGLSDCDLSTQTLGWDDTLNRFTCGTDSDTTYTAGQGLSVSAGNVFTLNSTITGALVRFSTLSGSTVFARNQLVSSGTLVTESGAYFDGTTMVIQAGTNRVGIGTASPTAKLEIFGSDSVGDPTVRISRENGGATISPYPKLELANQYVNAGDTVGGIEFVNNGATNTYSAIRTVSRSTFGSFTNAELQFFTLGDSSLIAKMVILSSGNVGIGDALPSTKLEVAGAISGATLYVSSSMSGAGLTDCDASTSALQWDSTTERFSCDTTGGNTYTAGQGLGLSAGNVFTLNSTITGALVRFTTLSGSTVTAKTSLASSGSLVWEGSASGASLWVSTFKGAGLTDCDLSTSVLKWDDTLNRFSCGSASTAAEVGTSSFTGAVILIGNDRWVNDNGDTMTGALVIDVLNGTRNTLGLNTPNTVSGSVIFANTALRSSGSLVWEGSASGASLWVSTFEGAGLSDCDLATQTLGWDDTLNRFTCGTDSDTTYTAGEGLSLNGTAFSLSDTVSGTLLEFTTVSGSTVFGNVSLRSSGSLVWEGSASGAALYLGGTIEGVGLIDCDADNQTLAWDATTKRFTCGDDDNSGSGAPEVGTSSFTGAVLLIGNDRWLNDNGDSMSGAFTIDVTGGNRGTVGLEVINTISGSVVYANTALRSSGSLVWEGSASGASLWVSTFEGAGLSDCDLSTQTLGWDDTLNRFTCGTDSDTTYTAGEGLTLTATAFSLSDSVSGTLLEFTTVSGSTVFGNVSLRSSGSLVWEGSASGATLYLGGTIEGVGLVDCDADNQTLAWDATTKRFTCGDDDNSGSGAPEVGTASFSGAILVLGNDRWVNDNGDLMSGALTIDVTGGNRNTLGLRVINTISGSVIFANTALRSSGSLVWEGAASGATLYIAQSLQGVGLTDCDTTTQLLRWDATTGRFSCGNTTGNSTFTGAVLLIGNDRWVNDNGGTMSGALTIDVTGGNRSTVGLEVINTISGSVIFGNTALRSSGSLVWEGAASGATLYIGGTIEGAGLLSDCDGDTQTLGWDATTKRFTCGDDDTSATGTPEVGTASFTGGVLRIGEDRWINDNGDTMTGDLVINGLLSIGTDPNTLYNTITTSATASHTAGGEIENGNDLFIEGALEVNGGVWFDGNLTVGGSTTLQATDINGALTIDVTGGNRGTLGLEVINTISGSVVYANTALRSSGSLVWEGAASGATLYIAQSLQGVGLTDCDTTTQLLRWDATTGRFSCGNTTGNSAFTGAVLAIGDDRWVNDNGDTMTGALTINMTSGFVGLKVIQTGSGAEFHADRALTSSGQIIVESSKVQGSGAFVVNQQGEFGTGAYIYASGASVLALDSGMRDRNTPHIVMGYQGYFDVSMWRTTGSILNLAGHLLPGTTNRYDLGSNTLRWRDLYLSGSSLHMGNSSEEAVIGYNTLSDYLGFDSNGTGADEMVILTSGNVGIGTVTPDTKLEVAGTVSGTVLYGRTSLRSSGSLVWEGAGSGSMLTLAGGNITFSSSGATTFNLDADNVDFRLNGFKNTSLLYLDAAGSGTTAASSGALGIGTVTPITQLHVAGVIPTKAMGSGSSATQPSSIVVQGRYAYITNSGSSTLKVFDVSQSSSPIQIGSVATSTKPVGIAVQGRYAYVIGYGGDRLQVFDISNPSVPTLTGSIATNSGPRGIAVRGRYAYIVNYIGNSMQVFDIGNPSVPQLRSTFSMDKNPWAITVKDRYAYVTKFTNGQIQIIDVQNPANPMTGSLLNVGIQPTSIYVQGRFAYITNSGSNTLQIVDVKNPLSPASLSTVTVGNGPQSVTVAGRYAYVANAGTRNLHTVDVSNPDIMSSLGSVRSGNGPSALAVNGRFAYVTNRNASSFHIFDIGGAYIQQLEAGGLEVAILNVRNSIESIDGIFAGSLNVGQSLSVAGNASFGQSVYVLNTNRSGGSGALVVDQRSNMTGAYIVSTATGAPILALDARTASGAQSPHILFGNKGVFDTRLFRSHTGSLTMASQTGVLLTLDSEMTNAKQSVFQIITDRSTDENRVFRITASGAVYSDAPYNSAGADYAEWFFSKDALQAGEVVCIDVTRKNAVERCKNAADGNLMGIVSSNPAFVGNSISGADGLIPPGYHLIGLIGQVPAHVTTEGGAIRPGDALTSASIPGYAKKAAPGDSTVGVALEGIETGQGFINVLISRRNQSLTVAAVEENVLKTIAALEIDDEVEIMIASALKDFNIETEIAEEVQRQLDVFHEYQQRLDQIANDINTLKGEVAYLRSQTGTTIIAGPATGTGTGTLPAHLTATSMELSSTLVTGGDVRAGGDFYIDGALHASSLIVPNGLTIDGGAVVTGELSANELSIESSATLNGVMTINGGLLLGSGAWIDFGSGSIQLADLLVRDSLFVMGDLTIQGLATFLGDLDVKGELRVSTRQAGTAIIESGKTSVMVQFSSGFTAIPVVTAVPNDFVYGAWRVKPVSQTGFTIELVDVAPTDLTFSWHALVPAGDQLAAAMSASIEGQTVFPIDSKGIPVSSNKVWNACIRNITLLDATGQPLSCARYHDAFTWTHPDLLIGFLWNTSVTPPLLKVPDGYVPTETEDAASVENAFMSEEEAFGEEAEGSSSSVSSSAVENSSSAPVTSESSSISSAASSSAASAEPFGPPAGEESSSAASQASSDSAQMPEETVGVTQ